MMARYEDKEYTLASNRSRCEILTRQKSKTDSTFLTDSTGMYYKPVTEDELTDIYSVEFLAYCDIGMEGTPLWWSFMSEDVMDFGNRIRLRPGRGLDEAHAVIVNTDEITKALLQFTYTKKGWVSVGRQVNGVYVPVTEIIRHYCMQPV